MVVGVPKEEHEKVLRELSGLQETLSKTQSALDAMQARVQALELGQARVPALALALARMDGQLELLVRMQQSTARPYNRRKRLRVHVGRIPIRLKQASVEHWVCAQFTRKVKRIR